MKWMEVCLTMTMLTGCTGQAEPTAAAQDETMEQVTIAAIGGSVAEGEEAKAFTIQCIGYSDGEETVTEAESDREDMSLSGKYAGISRLVWHCQPMCLAVSADMMMLYRIILTS